MPYTVHKSTLILGNLYNNNNNNKMSSKKKSNIVYDKAHALFSLNVGERWTQKVCQHLHKNVHRCPRSPPPELLPRLGSQLSPEGSTAGLVGVGSATTTFPIHPQTCVWKQKGHIQTAKSKLQDLSEGGPWYTGFSDSYLPSRLSSSHATVP